MSCFFQKLILNRQEIYLKIVAQLESKIGGHFETEFVTNKELDVPDKDELFRRSVR